MIINTNSIQRAIKKSKKVKGKVSEYSIQKSGDDIYFIKALKDGMLFAHKIDGEEIRDVKLDDKLILLIEKVKEDTLYFDFDEGAIKTDKRSLKFSQDSNEYCFDEFNELEQLEETKDNFKILMQTLVFASNNVARPCLGTINFKDNKVCALDGYRLCLREGSFNLSNSYCVHKEHLKTALGLIDRNTKGIIIKFSSRECMIEIDGSYLRYKLFDETFIDYKNIINEDYKTKISINSEMLIEEVDFISIALSKVGALLMQITNENLILSDTSATAEVKTDLISKVGPDMKIAISNIYLKDSLKNHSGDIDITFNSPVSPVVIKSPAIKGLDLILPVRIIR